MITARELMTADPITIPPEATIENAISVLQTLDIRHLPVVDAEGTLVGMLSDRDLRALSIPMLVGDEYLGSVRTTLSAPVATLMNGDVLAAAAEDDAGDLVECMLENKVGAIPVVDGDGLLVGIVSYVDVLRRVTFDENESEATVGLD